jgi:pilus assembly protein Flp/PilA
VSRFAADTSGATAIEYALIVAFIALAIITVVTQVGSSLKDSFQNLLDKMG